MPRVGSLAGPISSQAALVFVSSLVSLAFAGHLGGLALSQAVLASSCYNITGAAVLLGLASGMETLCGQVRSCRQHAPANTLSSLQSGTQCCVDPYIAGRGRSSLCLLQ